MSVSHTPSTEDRIAAVQRQFLELAPGASRECVVTYLTIIAEQASPWKRNAILSGLEEALERQRMNVALCAAERAGQTVLDGQSD